MNAAPQVTSRVISHPAASMGAGTGAPTGIKMTAATVLKRTACTSFATNDGALMLAHLRKAKRNGHYAYDVQPMLEVESELTETLRNGVIYLRSKNFGYDFMLVNVNAGTGLFGIRRSATRVYRSHTGADDYVHLEDASSLTKALALVNKMYREAAEQHLP